MVAHAADAPLTAAAIGLVLALAGLALVVVCAEKLVAGVVGTSLALGWSAFLVSVLFVGFDPENLFVGAVGAAQGMAGIALGSIVGAAMVACGLAFGFTALVAPMRFERAPRRVLALPIVAILLLALLALDGRLSRGDGVVLLGAFVLVVLELARLSRRGLDIRASGEVAESLERGRPGATRALVILVLALGGLVLGSELLVAGSRRLMSQLGLSETVYGMTILALAVSAEEIARELPAALRGRPEISVGNVVGSVLAFFLFNAGVIAVLHPIPVDPVVLRFYLPLCLATVILVMASLATLRIPRWIGGALVGLYAVFFIGAYVR
jgi:cation:H+ antiporter